MQEILLTTLSTTFLISVLVFLARHWILIRLRSAVEHEYNAKLENIKAENSRSVEQIKAQLAQQSSLVTLAHKSLSEFSAPFHAKRLEGLEVIWDAALSLDRLPPVIAGRLDILKPSEYTSNIASGFLWSMDDQEIVAWMNDRAAISRCRPFVGEAVWTYFFMYRATLGRICVLYKHGFDNGNIGYWLHDQHLKENVSVLLSEEELKQVLEKEVGSIAAFRTFAMSRFAAMISSAASGKDEPESHLRHAHLLAEQFAEAQRNS